MPFNARMLCTQSLLLSQRNLALISILSEHSNAEIWQGIVTQLQGIAVVIVEMFETQIQLAFMGINSINITGI